MKTVVFGAAGWLGRAVLQNLAGKHDIRAFDYGPQAWEAYRDLDGDWNGGEVVHGDIADYPSVERAISGVDCVIHTAVYFVGDPNDDKPFLINLKGLWNVLQAAQEQGVRKVVHIGSCQTVHPEGIFFSSEVRRPDGSLYAVCKRLQEEMCRQFHEAFETAHRGLAARLHRGFALGDRQVSGTIAKRPQRLGLPPRFGRSLPTGLGKGRSRV